MADTKTTSPAPKKRRGLRIVGILVGVLVLFIVVAYFVGTSSGFLKSVILPKVGKSMNAEITISDAAIHPFSSVTLHDLKVTPNGRETLLTAPEVRARYSLMDIIRGNINIEEVVIVSPTIHLVENVDGTSNLDPILNSQKGEKAPQEKAPKEKSSKPPQIDLKKLSLSNATLLKEKLYAGGTRDVMEVTNLNVTLTNLKNGDSGKLALNAELAIRNNPPSPGTNGILRATANGEYVFALSPDLKPVSVKGQTQLAVSRAEGAFADLAALGVNLTADVAPTEIKLVGLQFQRGGETLGELRISGPLDMEKSEGRLSVALSGIDKRVLNLVGASSGTDFGTTTISSTNEIQIANAGSLITVIGRFDASKLQLTRTNQSTPTLDIRADYNVNLNTTASNAVLRALTLTGTQNGQPLLNVELSSPMSINMGNANSAVGDSTLNLTLALNLADWKPFLGSSIPSGNIGVKAKVLSQQGGKQITLNGVTQLANIAPIGGDKKLVSATISTDIGVQLGANEDKTIKGGVQLTNVVVHDPSGSIPNTPLEVKLQIDTTIQKQVVDLRQLLVALTPTQRAKNQILLQGRIDQSDTNATQGNLKLSAESLDLTTYYDLFAANKTQATNAPGSTKPTTTPETSPTKPEEEPAAQQLPFRNFVAEVNIGRLYLREIEITNLLTTAKVDGGHIVLKPMQLSLNGAPVSAAVDLDLGVPGYRYAVEFNADQIPFAPLVNSFAPDRKGQLGGALSAHTQISGLGTTGVNLQKNLKGQFDIGTTNLNLAVVNIRNPILKTIINVVITLPQLLKNPESALGGLVGSLTGSGGGFTDDLSKSPVDVISARGSAGAGKVQLDQAIVRSAVFQVEAHGDVEIAPVLTNSTLQIPVLVSLNQSTASKLNLSSTTNSAYVALPEFLNIKGTAGKPKADINKVVLGTIAARSLGGAIPGTSKAGSLIQGILGGKPATNTNTTNAAPAQSPAGNLLNDLFKKKK